MISVARAMQDAYDRRVNEDLAEMVERGDMRMIDALRYALAARDRRVQGLVVDARFKAYEIR